MESQDKEREYGHNITAEYPDKPIKHPPWPRMRKALIVISVLALATAITYGRVITREIDTLKTKLETVESNLATTQSEIDTTTETLTLKQADLSSTEQSLSSTQVELTATNQELSSVQQTLTNLQVTLSDSQQQLVVAQETLLGWGLPFPRVMNVSMWSWLIIPPQPTLPGAS